MPRARLIDHLILILGCVAMLAPLALVLSAGLSADAMADPSWAEFRQSYADTLLLSPSFITFCRRVPQTNIFLSDRP